MKLPKLDLSAYKPPFDPPIMDYAEWVKAEYDAQMFGNSIVIIGGDGLKHVPILETIDPTKWETEE